MDEVAVFAGGFVMVAGVLADNAKRVSKSVWLTHPE